MYLNRCGQRHGTAIFVFGGSEIVIYWSLLVDKRALRNCQDRITPIITHHHPSSIKINHLMNFAKKIATSSKDASTHTMIFGARPFLEHSRLAVAQRSMQPAHSKLMHILNEPEDGMAESLMISQLIDDSRAQTSHIAYQATSDNIERASASRFFAANPNVLSSHEITATPQQSAISIFQEATFNKESFFEDFLIEPTSIGPADSMRVVNEVLVLKDHSWSEGKEGPVVDPDLIDDLITRKRMFTDFAPFEPPCKKSRDEDTQESNSEETGVLSETTSSVGDQSSSSVRSTDSSSVKIQSHHSTKWDEHFQDLVSFRQTHGHCLVPHNWCENPSLSQWVKRYRYQFKLKEEGRHSTLTDEREADLERLGFVWDSHEAVWEERLNELCAYRKIHHNCNVPTNFPENPALSIWVKNQRRQWKIFLAGNPSNKTEQRISRLTELEFAWNPRKLKIKG
jgi:hypothetical protein